MSCQELWINKLCTTACLFEWASFMRWIACYQLTDLLYIATECFEYTVRRSKKSSRD